MFTYMYMYEVDFDISYKLWYRYGHLQTKSGEAPGFSNWGGGGGGRTHGQDDADKPKKEDFCLGGGGGGIGGENLNCPPGNILAQENLEYSAVKSHQNIPSELCNS